MIPKIIHYCWFGKGLMPNSQKKNIRIWQKLHPDYKIIRWDERNFDLNICPYVQEAYRQKKYAYVSDVARLYALFKYGGIYLDTDVEVFKSLDSFRGNKAFSGIEMYRDSFEREGLPLLNSNMQPKIPGTSIPYCGMLSCIIGSESGNQLIKECLCDYLCLKPTDNYEGRFCFFIIDGFLANHAVKYGFRYEDKQQDLGIIKLYTSTVFSYEGCKHVDNPVVFHQTVNSWRPNSRKKRLLVLLDKMGIVSPNTVRKIVAKFRRIFK